MVTNKIREMQISEKLNETVLMESKITINVSKLIILSD